MNRRKMLAWLLGIVITISVSAVLFLQFQSGLNKSGPSPLRKSFDPQACAKARSDIMAVSSLPLLSDPATLTDSTYVISGDDPAWADALSQKEAKPSNLTLALLHTYGNRTYVEGLYQMLQDQNLWELVIESTGSDANLFTATQIPDRSTSSIKLDTGSIPANFRLSPALQQRLRLLYYAVGAVSTYCR